MSILENSRIVRWIVHFWTFICRLYAESFLSVLIGGLVRVVRSGCIWRFLTHDGLDRHWTDSGLCRLLQWLFDLPARFFAWLGRLAPGSRIASLCKTVLVPALGVMMFLLFTIPQEKWNNLYSLAMAAALCLLYFFISLSGEKHALNVRGVGVWPVLFFLLTAASWLWADERGQSTRFLFFAVTCALTVLLTVSAADTERKLMTVLRISTVGLAVCAIYALYQRATGVEVDELLTDLSIHADMPGRVFSFFENPNSFANLLVFFSPLMLSMAIHVKKPAERIAYLLVFLLCGLALVMTYSRGGWLAIVLAAAVFTFCCNKRLIPALFVVGLLALPLMPESVLIRLSTIGNKADSSTMHRIDIWRGVLALIGDHDRFLTGIGLGPQTFRRIYPFYSVGFFCDLKRVTDVQTDILPV